MRYVTEQSKSSGLSILENPDVHLSSNSYFLKDVEFRNLSFKRKECFFEAHIIACKARRLCLGILRKERRHSPPNLFLKPRYQDALIMLSHKFCLLKAFGWRGEKCL